MVNRTLLLFVLLGGLFIVLCTVLLNAQLPENTPLFALFHHTDNLDLLLLQSYTLPRIAIALLAGGTLALPACYCNKMIGNPLGLRQHPWH